MSQFDLLSKDSIQDIAFSLSLKDIFNLGRTSRRLNQVICRDESFWRRKFTQEFFNYQNYQEYRGSWRQLYFDFFNIWSCGYNMYGQLGLGHEYHQTNPTPIPHFNLFGNLLVNLLVKAKRVSAGSSHSIFIDLESKVGGCGSNADGQLGLDDRGNRYVPTPIVDFNLLGRAIEVTTKRNHTLLLDLENNVWGFGDNSYGQLGLFYKQGLTQPTKISNFRAQQVSTGLDHTVFIDMVNNVLVCGNNHQGQLGLANVPESLIPTLIPNLKAKQVSAGYYHTVIIDLENNVWVWGGNRHGQLGIGNNNNQSLPIKIPNFRASQVSAGSYHTIFIDLDNNVWVCGNNQFGELGLGNTQNRNKPTPIPNLNLLGKAKQVSAGFYHTVIIDLENNVWTFGLNNAGQLGLGDMINSNIPTKIPNFKAQYVSAGSRYTLMIGTKL